MSIVPGQLKLPRCACVLHERGLFQCWGRLNRECGGERGNQVCACIHPSVAAAMRSFWPLAAPCRTPSYKCLEKAAVRVRPPGEKDRCAGLYWTECLRPDQ